MGLDRLEADQEAGAGEERPQPLRERGILGPRRESRDDRLLEGRKPRKSGEDIAEDVGIPRRGEEPQGLGPDGVLAPGEPAEGPERRCGIF